MTRTKCGRPTLTWTRVQEPVGKGGQGLPELLGRAAAVSLIKGLQVPCVFLWRGHGQTESEHRLGGLSRYLLCVPKFPPVSPHPHCSLRVFSAPLSPVTSSTSFRDMFTGHQRCCGSAPNPRDDVGHFALSRVFQRRSLHGGSLSLVRCPCGATTLCSGSFPQGHAQTLPDALPPHVPWVPASRTVAPRTSTPVVQQPRGAEGYIALSKGASCTRGSGTTVSCHRQASPQGGTGEWQGRGQDSLAQLAREKERSEIKDESLHPGQSQQEPATAPEPPQGQTHPEISPSCSPDSQQKSFPTVCSFAERSHSPTSGTRRRGERMEDVPLTGHGRGRRHVCLEHSCVSSARGLGQPAQASQQKPVH